MRYGSGRAGAVLERKIAVLKYELYWLGRAIDRLPPDFMDQTRIARERAIRYNRMVIEVMTGESI